MAPKFVCFPSERAATAAVTGKDVPANLRDDKVRTARFYADHILTRATGLARSVLDGADSVLAFRG